MPAPHPPPPPAAVGRRDTSVPTARDVAHVGVTVPDLDEAVAFFTGALGGDLLYREGPFRDDGPWMTDHLGVDRGDVLRLAAVRLGPSTNVELLEYRGADADAAPASNAHAGTVHLALYVDDLDAALGYLRRQPGVAVQGEPTRLVQGPTAGLTFVYVRAPWGLQLELLTYPGRLPYEDETPHRLRPPAPAWRSSSTPS